MDGGSTRSSGIIPLWERPAGGAGMGVSGPKLGTGCPLLAAGGAGLCTPAQGHGLPLLPELRTSGPPVFQSSPVAGRGLDAPPRSETGIKAAVSKAGAPARKRPEGREGQPGRWRQEALWVGARDSTPRR